MVYDLGGNAGIRAIWPEYYAEVHAFVFVLDLADRPRFAEAKDELAKVTSATATFFFLFGRPVRTCTSSAPQK